MGAGKAAHPGGWRFDREVWRLAQRGYSAAYILARLGCSAESLRGALRRIRCGRYGSPPDFGSL